MVKEHKLSVIKKKKISSEDLVYNMVIVVNKTVLYPGSSQREYLKCSYHTLTHTHTHTQTHTCT